MTRRISKSKSASMSHEMTLELSKETKGTFVYRSDEDDCPVPTLYIKKLGRTKAPDSIVVTIEEEK